MVNPLDIVMAIREKKIIRVGDLAKVIEDFAPKSLQESYDNTGLQVGDPEMAVSAVLLCLDITEEILDEAKERSCNMIISHHPLIFRGLKHLTGESSSERIVIRAIKENIAIYSAHTNLDSAWDGVSHEMAHLLGLSDIRPLEPKGEDTGLGVIGNFVPTPKIEFLRRVKETFKVESLKYSAQWSGLVVRRVALCGGSGASLIANAIAEGADAMITGDVKYHDFTESGSKILIADTGHYESEICSRNILSRIIRERYPECLVYFSEEDRNPVGVL